MARLARLLQLVPVSGLNLEGRAAPPFPMVSGAVTPPTSPTHFYPSKMVNPCPKNRPPTTSWAQLCAGCRRVKAYRLPLHDDFKLTQAFHDSTSSAPRLMPLRRGERKSADSSPHPMSDTPLAKHGGAAASECHKPVALSAQQEAA